MLNVNINKINLKGIIYSRFQVVNGPPISGASVYKHWGTESLITSILIFSNFMGTMSEILKILFEMYPKITS